MWIGQVDYNTSLDVIVWKCQRFSIKKKEEMLSIIPFKFFTTPRSNSQSRDRVRKDLKLMGDFEN